MRKGYFSLSVFMILVLALTACNLGMQQPFPTPTMRPSDTPQPTEQPTATQLTGPILIESTTSYLDDYGDYYVVALIKNISDQPLKEITFDLQIRDANGESLIFDDSGNPVENTEVSTLLSALAPGEESPLSYYITPPQGTTPASFQLDYAGSEPAGVDRGNLALEHAHFTNDNNGTYYIFGEMVNKGNQPVIINELAGTLVDSAGKTLAANNTLNMVEYLAAAGDAEGLDRAPFGVTIYAPKGTTGELNWNVYVDADVTEPLSTRGVQFALHTLYEDSQGGIHIVGVVRHSDTRQLSFPIQGFLTDAEGNILDTFYYLFPINLDADTNLPFDITSWNQVNYNDADKAAVTHGYAQVDPSWIWEGNEVYLLGTEENGTPFDMGNGEVRVTGTAVNSTGAALDKMVVMITFFDSAQTTIMGTAYETLWPSGDVFTAGEKMPFDFSMYLDPAQDSSSFVYQIQVIGVQASQ